MALWLRQSTSVDVVLGLFVDQTDGFTPETGLSIAASDVRLKKHGAAWGAKSSGGASHSESGFYTATLSTTDTNTLGTLELYVAVAGARIFQTEYMVLPATVYDSLVAGSDRLQVDVEEIGAGIITAASIAADAIGSSEFADSAAAKVADAVWDEARSGHVGSGTFGEGVIVNSIATDAVSTGALAAGVTAEIADAVWDEAKAGHVTAGTFGEGVSVNSLATGVITAASLAAAAGSKLADIIWRRSYSSIRTSGDGDAVATRNPLWAIAKLINKISLSGGTLTITHENDSTTLFTQSATATAGNPITGLDTD